MTGVFRLVHPFPSALNSVLVLGIALVAGTGPGHAALLALGMLGLQFCIGAVNDLFDVELDAASKPYKPIPAGLVSRRRARLIAAASGAGGLVAALAATGFDPLIAVLYAVMLGAGLAYDAWLKPTRFAWVCFAVAFPVLPVYAWYGAMGALPPRWEILLPVAALCGPALQIANGLIDLEPDAEAGLRTLPVTLGRGRSIVVMTALMAVVHFLAWVTLPADADPIVAAISGIAGALALGGVMLSRMLPRVFREIGWSAQAASIAVLGFGWLLSAAG